MLGCALSYQWALLPGSLLEAINFIFSGSRQFSFLEWLLAYYYCTY